MDRSNCMAIGIFLLLGVVVFTAGQKVEISSKRKEAISCGPVGHNSWPKDGGNGCAHQSVSAAFLGRNKRERTHGC